MAGNNIIISAEFVKGGDKVKTQVQVSEFWLIKKTHNKNFKPTDGEYRNSDLNRRN